MLLQRLQVGAGQPAGEVVGQGDFAPVATSAQYIDFGARVDRRVECLAVGIAVALAWRGLGSHDDSGTRVAQRLPRGEGGAAEGKGTDKQDGCGGFQPGRASPQEQDGA